MDTLAHIIDAVKADLDPLLAPTPNIQRIRAAAADLPADLVSFVGFETRLSGDAGGVDFAFNLSDDGLRRLARSTPAPSWRRLTDLCSLWGEQASPPFSNGGELWVELDFAADRDAFPAPNVFLAPAPSPDAGDDSGPDLELVQWILDRAVPTFLGRDLDPKISQHVMGCLQAAPSSLSKFQIGLMGARPVDALRLCLFGLSAADLDALIARLPWPGPAHELAAAASRYAPMVDHFGLHLDIGTRLFPSFGLELLFDRSPWDYQPEDEPRWRRLLDRLVEDGRAEPAQRDALLAWPGLSFDQALIFESALRNMVGREPSPLDSGRVTRGLAYIKLSRDPAGRDLTKAYFGAYHDGRHTTPPSQEA